MEGRLARVGNLTASCTTMAVGCPIAGLVGNTHWAVLGPSLATIGLYAQKPDR